MKKELSLQDLEELYEEVYDKWTWETGSEEDKKLIIELKEEIELRKKAPMYTFNSDPSTGIYKSKPDEISFAVDGITVKKIKIK